jgi:type III secretory pathway lipoprotein EscJ
MAILLAVLLIGVIGCGRRAVVEDVSQNESNKIVTVLGSFGIRSSSERGTGGHGVYKVSVDERDYTAAVTLLTAHHLPAEKQISLNELLSEGGLLPGSRDFERLKIDRARGVQVEQALLSFPGVEGAHVVVNDSPVQSSFGSFGPTPQNGASESERKVAVVIETRPSASINQGEIKQLVAAALPGISVDKVSLSVASHAPLVSQVAVHEVGVESNVSMPVISLPLVSLLNVRVVGDDLVWLKIVLGLLFVGALVIGYFGKVWVDRGGGNEGLHLPWNASAPRTSERRSVRVDDHRGEEQRTLPNPESREAEKRDSE